MFSKLKSTMVFVCNILVSMFIRRTYKESLKLLGIVLGGSIVLCSFIYIGLFFNLFTPASELGNVISWLSEGIMYFLDLEKIKYIIVTYFIALIVHLFAELIIDQQTIHNKIPREKLIYELRVNTRAVLITMTNSLSLVIKLLILIVLILGTFIYFGSSEFTEVLALSQKDIFNFLIFFAVFEFFMFIFLKWGVLPY